MLVQHPVKTNVTFFYRSRAGFAQENKEENCPVCTSNSQNAAFSDAGSSKLHTDCNIVTPKLNDYNKKIINKFVVFVTPLIFVGGAGANTSQFNLDKNLRFLHQNW